MLTTLIAWAEQLEQTPLAIAIAESRYLFPAIEGVHLLGLSLSVGLIFFADLRLLGLLFKRTPSLNFLRQLRPCTLIGFALTFVSGVLLFVAEASAMVASPAFAFKLLFIALAGVNVLYFEIVLARHSRASGNRSASISYPLKISAAASLALWLAVVICGRLIPYLPAWP